MNYFNPYVNRRGGIVYESWKELYEIVFKEGILLPQKVYFILILRQTDKEIIDEMDKEGLNEGLFSWLLDAKRQRYIEFIIELLIAFKKIEGMEAYSEEIKSLSVLDDPRITKIAQELLLMWSNKKTRLEVLEKVVQNKPERVKYSTVKIRQTQLRSAGIGEPDTDTAPSEVSKTKKYIKRSVATNAVNQPTSPAVVPPNGVPGKLKKRVSWAIEDSFLVIIEYEKLENDKKESKATTAKKAENAVPSHQTVLGPSELKIGSAPDILSTSTTVDNGGTTKILDDEESKFLVAQILCSLLLQNDTSSDVSQITQNDVHDILLQYCQDHNDPVTELISLTTFQNLSIVESPDSPSP